MAKRTKQVEKMISEVNDILKKKRVIDEYSSDIFWTMQYLLLRTDTYRGYNWFYEVDYTDVVGKTTKVQRLAGTSDSAELKKLNAYIQLY